MDKSKNFKIIVFFLILALIAVKYTNHRIELKKNKININLFETHSFTFTLPYSFLFYAKVNQNGIASPLFIKNKQKIKIGIIDTGVDFSHPLLRPFMSPNQKSEVISKRNESYDHGTSVAGVIALRLYEIFGQDAPNYVEIISYQIPLVFENGKNSYDFSSVKTSLLILQAALDKVDILNLSLSGKDNSFEELISLKLFSLSGAKVVTAAGNDSMSTKRVYPCAYKVKNLICVGNVSKNFTLSSSSNYGKEVSFVAFGENIISTSYDSSFDHSTGTSMSTPQVAAFLAIKMITSENQVIDIARKNTGATTKINLGRSFATK